MNDPHVEALEYVVKHSRSVSYENPQCDCELPKFRITIEGHRAIIKPKDHFATAEEARAVIEPLLRAWELDVALKYDDPDVLRFAYLAPHIIDRNPTPGATQAREPVLVTIRGPEENFT